MTTSVNKRSDSVKNFRLTAVVPVTRTGLHGRRGGDGITPGYAIVFPRLLFDDSSFRLGAYSTLRLLPRLVTGTKLVEAKGTGPQMSALIKATFVADNFSRVQGRAAP